MQLRFVDENRPSVTSRGRRAQRRERPLEVLGERRRKPNRVPASGMREGDLRRVQRGAFEAAERRTRLSAAATRSSRAVHHVARDRMAGVGQMDAGLVGAAGVETDADEGRERQFFEGPDLGFGSPRVPAPAAVALPRASGRARWVRRSGGVPRTGPSPGPGTASPPGVPRRPRRAAAARARCGRRPARRSCPGRGDGPVRARPGGPTCAISGYRWISPFARVPSRWPGPGVDHQPRRFVDHDQPRVFMENVERHRFRGQGVVLAGGAEARGAAVARSPDAHPLTRTAAVTGTADPPVEQDEARLHPARRLAAADLRKALRSDQIQAPAVLGRADLELEMRLAGVAGLRRCAFGGQEARSPPRQRSRCRRTARWRAARPARTRGDLPGGTR